MDFIFDDEAEDVGSDIEAYCPKCKSDTAHTVITKYEEEVRRVQCSVCGDVHTFRKPRGEETDDTPEPAAAKKRLAAKKPSWQEAKDRAGNKGLATARPYSIRDTYDEGDVVTHPKFGVGFVTEITENKCEVTFEDERRVLIHNRPDLAAQMPAIAQIPAPRAEKKKKGKKGARAAKGAAVEVAPPPAPVAPPAPAAKEGKPGKEAKPAKGAAPAKAAPAKAAPPAKAAKGKPEAAKKAAAPAPAKKATKPAAKPAAKKPAAKKPAPKKPAKPAKKHKK